MTGAATLTAMLSVSLAVAAASQAAAGGLSGDGARGLLVPVASSNAHRPDAMGNYGGLKRSSPSIRSRGSSSSTPRIIRRKYPEPVVRQPYPYKYYQGTSRGNYGCDWLARRATDTNNLNWWARYRSCTRNRTDFDRPSYLPRP